MYNGFCAYSNPVSVCATDFAYIENAFQYAQNVRHSTRQTLPRFLDKDSVIYDTLKPGGLFKN